MSEVWCQKELSQVGGREALMRVHKQMVVVTDQMHQKHRRDRWNHKVVKLQESRKAGSALLFEWIRNESRPQMRVLQKKRDDETTEEIRTLTTDPEEIHEVIARARQDIFRRWDKEEKPTWQNFERNYQHLWDTQPQMNLGELHVDQMMKKMKTWGAKKAGWDGWARSEWKQLTPEMVKPMRDRMTKMEETVKDKTMEQLMKDPVWPTTVSTAAVALIPKEANQTPTPLDLRPITVTCLLYNLWAGTRFIDVIRWCKTWLPKSVAGGIPENRIQERVCGLCCWQWKVKKKEWPQRRLIRPNFSTWSCGRWSSP